MESIINLSYQYYNEALNLIKINNVTEAKYKLYEAIKLYDSDCDILNLVASCEYLLCNFDKAKYFWERSLKLKPDNKKIESYLNYIISNEFKNLLTKYNDSITLIKNNNYKDAIQLMLQVIETDSNIIEPYYIIGVCYAKEKQYENAIKYLKDAKNRDIGNQNYLELLNEVMDNNLSYESDNNTVNKKLNSLKYITIFSMVLLVLFGGGFIYKNKIVKEKENIISEEIKKSDELSLKLSSKENEVTDLNKEKEILKQELSSIKKQDNIVAKEVCEKLYTNSVNYYKSKQYNKAVVGFKYIIENIEDENYLKEEAIYLTALSYEHLKDFDLAKQYYKLYIDKYPSGNYYEYSIYNMKKL